MSKESTDRATPWPLGEIRARVTIPDTLSALLKERYGLKGASILRIEQELELKGKALSDLEAAIATEIREVKDAESLKSLADVSAETLEKALEARRAEAKG